MTKTILNLAHISNLGGEVRVTIDHESVVLIQNKIQVRLAEHPELHDLNQKLFNLWKTNYDAPKQYP